MGRNIARWILDHRSTPIRLLGSTVSAIYDFLFGWLDRRLARKNEAKLAEGVHNALPFLFGVHGGRFVPNEGVPFPPGFDYGFVTVAVDNILIRFCRGRGDLDVQIASKDAPGEWHEICLLLNLLEKKEYLQSRDILDMPDASRLMEPHMDQLKSAFSGDLGRDLKRRLADVYADDKVAIREAEWEINQRLRSARRS